MPIVAAGLAGVCLARSGAIHADGVNGWMLLMFAVFAFLTGTTTAARLARVW